MDSLSQWEYAAAFPIGEHILLGYCWVALATAVIFNLSEGLPATK